METRKKYFILFDFILLAPIALLPTNIFSQTQTLSTSLCGQTVAGTPCPGATNVELYDFAYNITSGNPAFTSIVGWTTTGTYTAADITGFTLYVTNFCAFNTSTPLQTLPASGPGTKTFTFVDPLPAGPAQRYFWITTNFTAGAVAGRTITVNIITAAMTTITGTESFGTNTIGGTQTICNSLPIELISFSGKHTEGKNILSWTTSSETNNDYFTVEKSFDGFNFDAHTNVQGAGTSNTNLNYEAIDITPGSKKLFYRLKQTDFNGNFKYSEVIVIDTKEYYGFEIYPNPAKSQIVISSSETDEFVLLNYLGKKITTINSNAEADISFLEYGIYFIVDKNGISRKFIKF